MKLNWRGKEYTFTPRRLIAEKDKDGQGAKVTVGSTIYAFDTESVALEDRYEPITFQVSHPEGEYLEYIPPKAKALEQFIESFVRRFSWTECINRYCFMYAHNLTYDWLQLIKHYPDLVAMSRTGIGFDKDYLIYERDDYKVILKKGGLFVGTAPHFTIQVRFSKREYMDIMFRDTFSFFPSSLATLTKSLGIVEKMERQESLGRIDWRTEPESEEKTYFEKYAKIDALATRLVAEKIRDLHSHAGMKRIRVSSPGYAINKLYHSIPEGTVLVSGPDDPDIMQLVLDSYAGGRTGGVHHGHVENLAVLDFHSSYPASMMTLPSFSPTMEYVSYPDPDTLSTEDLYDIIDECHCFMRIDGEETDARYPTLIRSVDGKLVPVYGRFEGIATTGVEVSVGLRSGSLRIDRIHELVVLIETDEEAILPFNMFISDAYHRKENSPKGSPDYQSAKLEMNSSYGKLIESRDETKVSDDVGNVAVVYVEGEREKFAAMYYRAYIESLNEESDTDFESSYMEIAEAVMDTFDEDEVNHTTFKSLSLTKLEYGRYAIPAAAALITATSRARLLVGMKAASAIYWDTDSIFIENYDPESLTPDLERGREWLPAFVQGVRVGDDLGDLDVEIEGARGYLAGTKRYYLINDEGVEKKAMHGIPTAPFERANEMIKALATGDAFRYEGRARPVGVRETKDRGEIGRFKSSEYEAQFHLDSRLHWEKVPGGWSGRVKTIEEIVSRETK